MNGAITVITAGLLLIASTLTLLASIGLLRFDTVYGRIHPVTKAITLGVVLAAVAAALQVGDPSNVAKLVLVAVFQVVTAPIAAHMVARAAHRTGERATTHLAIDELRDARPDDAG